MIRNLHTFSEKFFYCYGTSYHVTNIQNNKWHLRFSSNLLCKEKESTKHLLVTSLIARKSLRTHTIPSRSQMHHNLPKYPGGN